MSVLSFFRRSSRSYSNRVTGPRRTRGVRREPQPRRPVFLEPLEDRRMLGLGDLLQTINDPNTLPQWGSQFGSAVAADGNLAVVGTPWADVAGWEDNVGRAYVFNSATGALVATLDNPTPNNPVLGKADQFGVSVALSGDTVVVGAQFEDPGGVEDAGAAYIFDATTGNLLRTLDSPTPARDGCFGESVALSGSTVVVGSRLIDTGANNAGAAYIFDAASGNLRWTLNNPTPTDDEEFGASVAVSGSIAVVGAPYDLIGASRPGSAYIFDAATGNLLRTLNSPAPEGGQLFGASVAISGNTVVVGRGVPWIQAAYVFDAATGNLLSSLEASSGQPVAVSGNTVVVSGSTVVVGAPYDLIGASHPGSAYIFDAATGSLRGTLNNPTPADYDEFGNSVAVSGSTLVVGAPRDDTGATDAGSVYIFNAAPGGLRRGRRR